MLTLGLSAVSLLSLYGGIRWHRRLSHAQAVADRLDDRNLAQWQASMTHRSSRFAG